MNLSAILSAILSIIGGLLIGFSLARLWHWASNRHGLDFSEADHERLHRSADGGGIWPDVWPDVWSSRYSPRQVDRIEADDPRLSSYQEWANGKKR